MFKLKRTNPGLHQETRSPVYDRDGGPLGDEPLQSVASIPQVHPVTSEVKGGRRVLVVAPQPFYEDRGTPICVRQVVEALAQLGHRVDILTYPIGQNLGSAAVAVHRSSNPFRISNVPVGFSLRKLLLDSTLVIRLRQLLASGRYDAVHAVEEAAFPAALWGPKFGVPVIYDMHSSMAEQMGSLTPFRNGIGRRFFGGMERWLLDRASLVVSSAGLARRVREISPAARIREWRFSSEIAPVEPLQVAALRESLRIAPHQRVVLYSGTFERYQGLRTLLVAIPQVLAENPDAVFVLVGVDGEQAAVRIQRVAKAIPGERLRLVSRQPRHSIPTYFAMADVLVSPGCSAVIFRSRSLTIWRLDGRSSRPISPVIVRCSLTNGPCWCRPIPAPWDTRYPVSFAIRFVPANWRERARTMPSSICPGAASSDRWTSSTAHSIRCQH